MKLIHVGAGHPRNVEFIQRACQLFHITYVHTNNPNFKGESNDIIWSPMGWIDPDNYPNSKIIFGPQFWVFPNPSDPLFTRAKPDHAKRCIYVCLSDWIQKVFTEFIPESRQIIPFVPIPFGLDIGATPKGTPELDCIIYFKARHPALLDACKAFVASKGLRYKVYSYGSYTREEYVDTLRKTHFAIWIGSHESQGFGLQECLATGTPIYVWDVTSMKDEWYSGFSYQGHSERLLATSAPYWSEQCGLKVYSQAEFETRFDEFRARLPSYRPTDYVQQTLTDRVCFQRFLDVLQISPSLPNDS
jgi:glycosyltransferase involved in cell wall biosynthesis